MKNLNNIKLEIWNCNRMGLEKPEKFKTVLNEKTHKLVKKSGNISKHLLRSKSLHSLWNKSIYDLDTMIVDTDDQSKLEQLKKSNDKSYNVKSAEHIPVKF